MLNLARVAKTYFIVAVLLPAQSWANLTSHGEHVETCAIDPKAIVTDACASFATLNDLNHRLQPSIRALTQSTDFFSYYRLNLFDKECPFWSDQNSMCGNIACAVTTIEDENDIPQIWRAEELSKLRGPVASHPSRETQDERGDQYPLQGELGVDVDESCIIEQDECSDRDYCVPEDESALSNGDYVSLTDNPERFTGYSGPGARQVWEAIYRENCFATESDFQNQGVAGRSGGAEPSDFAMYDFKNVIRDNERQQTANPLEELSALDDECLEKRVFYRIISGMHACISTQICHEYLNQSTGEWGPNLQCFVQRLHEHPERVSNLYFNYALLLRAVEKARNNFAKYTFCSGDVAEDARTKAKMVDLSDKIRRGPPIYDESLMFQDPSVQGLKDDFRNRFRNVSRIMDCVGCDKCRLWGKLQTAGYGTALKILFEFSDDVTQDNPFLRRTELVALVNTLDKLSSAIAAINNFETMLEHKPEPSYLAIDEFDEEPDTDSEPDSPFAAAKAEAYMVWRAFRWTLVAWTELPRKFFYISILELSRLYEFWIGLPVGERSWKLQLPQREDL